MANKIIIIGLLFYVFIIGCSPQENIPQTITIPEEVEKSAEAPIPPVESITEAKESEKIQQEVNMSARRERFQIFCIIP